MAHSRTTSVLCALLLFIPSCLRLQAQDENNTTRQSTYEVRGAVENSVTHEPIARALVTIAGETSNSQLTDNEGRFEFPNATAGRCVLEARKPGFFGTSSGREVFVPIAVGPNDPEHTLTLEPAGTIMGQVTMPVSDTGGSIRVQLMRRIVQEGRGRWQPAGMKMTNSEGAFRFGNLQPGDYKLFTGTSMDSDTMLQGPVNWGYPSVWYPENGDSGTTGFLRVGPGQALNAQLALTREPFYSVTIPVANRATQRIGLQVSDGRGHLNDVFNFYDSRQQQFRVYLPNGDYTVTVQASMPSPAFASLPVMVRNAPVQTQALTPVPIHPVPVTIRREFTPTSNGSPQIVEIENGKQVEVSRDLNLMLVSVTNDEMVGMSLRHEPGGDESSWLLGDVAPGRYWVQTYANQGYVASISAGGTDLDRDPLIIGQGGASAPIEIVLRNDMATLAVRVKNVSPPLTDTAQSTEAFVIQAPIQIPTGYLYLVPQFDTSSIVQEGTPLQQTTSLSNLQPGAYRVLALDRPLDLEYRNPKALEAYTGKGVTVTLEPNGKANIDLDVVSAEEAAQ